MADVAPITPQRLADAYQAVFGQVDKRGSDQALVWADIESFCYAHRLCREGKPDGDLSNNFDLNEGRRSFYLRARGMLIRAGQPEKVVKVSRKPKPNPIQHGQPKPDS